jgi:hypothetical protein
MAGFWSFHAAAVADSTEATSSPAKKKILAPPVQSKLGNEGALPHRPHRVIIGKRMRRRIKGTQEKQLKIVQEIVVGSCRADWK